MKQQWTRHVTRATSPSDTIHTSLSPIITLIITDVKIQNLEKSLDSCTVKIMKYEQ